MEESLLFASMYISDSQHFTVSVTNMHWHMARILQPKYSTDFVEGHLSYKLINITTIN